MFVFYIFVAMLIVASSGTSTEVCPAGHTYNDGCNGCKCSDAGNGYACTLKYCGDNPIVCYNKNKISTNCVPGHSYNDGCNTCACQEGIGYVCTAKACPDNPVVCYVR